MSLPSYVINFDELVDLLKGYLENGINVDLNNITFSTEDIERLLNDIKDNIQGVDYNDLINALNALGVKLDGLSGSLGISGTQKIYGKMLEIPAVKGQNIIEVNYNGKLTGITYSQSTWRFEDSWDLVVGENKLFDGVRTKEYGEHKYFNVFYPIDGIIKFIYNNNSSTSKVVWVDFNILEDDTSNTTIIDNTTTTDKNYRLLAVGESIYTLEGANNLAGCVYDAENISNLFKDHKEYSKFKNNIVAKNKTKAEILQLIKDTFANSKENDINYLFWSGHGVVVNNNFALVAIDNIITTEELESILDNVAGTKIILIDTCHSGLAINKDFAYELAKVEDKFRCNDKSLNKQGYKVITASAGSETSKDLSANFYGNPNPSGAFTWALTQSIVDKKADKDNNKIITLQELYETILHFYDDFNIQHTQAAITQKAQVYPISDNTPVFIYKEGA